MNIKYLSLMEEMLKHIVLIKHIGIEMMTADLLTRRLLPKIFVNHVEYTSLTDKSLLA